MQSEAEALAELKRWQMDVEEREAAVCPEDVGFDEYIRRLEANLKQAVAERDELSTEIETCHSLLDQFYSEDPAMTSADTLEKRLKLHLDELRPVITDGDVNGDD